MTIKAKLIIEILGRPVEHLKQTISDLVDKIGTEKGVSLLNKEIHDVKKVEKADNLWTTFADIDLSFESLPILFNTVMTYLPAHIEIYEPEGFKMNTFEMNDFVNFVVQKLHNYDALAKRMVSEREILINKLEFIRKGGDPKVVFAPVQKIENPTPTGKKEKVNKEKKKTKKKAK